MEEERNYASQLRQNQYQAKRANARSEQEQGFRSGRALQGAGRAAQAGGATAKFGGRVMQAAGGFAGGAAGGAIGGAAGAVGGIAGGLPGMAAGAGAGARSGAKFGRKVGSAPGKATSKAGQSAQRGGQKLSAVGGRLRLAQSLARRARGQVQKNTKGSPATAAKKLLNAHLLKLAWIKLIPSFGLTAIYLNFHLFMAHILRSPKYTKFGREWTKIGLGQGQNPATQTGGYFLGWAEIAGVVLIDLLVAFFFLLLIVQIIIVFAIAGEIANTFVGDAASVLLKAASFFGVSGSQEASEALETFRQFNEQVGHQFDVYDNTSY